MSLHQAISFAYSVYFLYALPYLYAVPFLGYLYGPQLASARYKKSFSLLAVCTGLWIITAEAILQFSTVAYYYSAYYLFEGLSYYAAFIILSRTAKCETRLVWVMLAIPMFFALAFLASELALDPNYPYEKPEGFLVFIVHSLCTHGILIVGTIFFMTRLFCKRSTTERFLMNGLPSKEADIGRFMAPPFLIANLLSMCVDCLLVGQAFLSREMEQDEVSEWTSVAFHAVYVTVNVVAYIELPVFIISFPGSYIIVLFIREIKRVFAKETAGKVQAAASQAADAAEDAEEKLAEAGV